MGTEVPAGTSVVVETLVPFPPPPALVDDVANDAHDPKAAAAAACTSTESSEPSEVPNCGLSGDQAAIALQPHDLAAAGDRVSEALQQVVESVETRLLGALRQAVVDIMEKLGKEAAVCLLASERKAAMLEQELLSTKQQTLSMLMRIKHVSDAQICDAENKVLVERRRAQDAETKLSRAQESNRRMKAELKRKVQLLEEFERSLCPTGTQQGSQLVFSVGSDIRTRGRKLKGSAGEKSSRRTSNPCELATPNLTAAGRSMNGVGLQCSSTARRAGIPNIDLLPPAGICINQVEEDGHVILAPNCLQDKRSPTDNLPGAQHEPPSPPVHSYNTFHQDGFIPFPMEQAQLPSSTNANLELGSKAVKEVDEDKSCLTVDALHCNEEPLSAQVHVGQEYQSNVDHVDMELQPSRGVSVQHQICNDSLDIDHANFYCTEQLEAEEAPEGLASHNQGSCKKTEQDCGGGCDNPLLLSASAPATKIPDGSPTHLQRRIPDSKLGNACLEHCDGREATETPGIVEEAAGKPAGISPDSGNHKPIFVLAATTPELKPISEPDGHDPPRGHVDGPETQKESPHNQVLRRKRKVRAPVPKFDNSGAKDRNTKRRVEEGPVTGGAFDQLLAAAGVDNHISSRDSRRLMQGARQLFSLAERKWR